MAVLEIIVQASAVHLNANTSSFLQNTSKLETEDVIDFIEDTGSAVKGIFFSETEEEENTDEVLEGEEVESVED